MTQIVPSSGEILQVAMNIREREIVLQSYRGATKDADRNSRKQSKIP
jgi:hypothetical protein